MTDPGDWAALAATSLELEVPADPSSLTVVRHVTGGMAAALGYDASGVADLRLAVTEVCASFVRARPRHGEDRCLRVGADLLPGALRVRVTDPVGPPPGHASGPPLPLLAALTDAVELHRPPGGGLEVRLTFLMS